MQLQKGPQQNLVSASGAQHENWAESNMADSSSRTDTSGDMDADDRNQRVTCLNSFFQILSHGEWFVISLFLHLLRFI